MIEHIMWCIVLFALVMACGTGNRYTSKHCRYCGADDEWGGLCEDCYQELGSGE